MGRFPAVRVTHAYCFCIHHGREGRATPVCAVLPGRRRSCADAARIGLKAGRRGLSTLDVCKVSGSVSVGYCGNRQGIGGGSAGDRRVVRHGAQTIGERLSGDGRRGGLDRFEGSLGPIAFSL